MRSGLTLQEVLKNSEGIVDSAGFLRKVKKAKDAGEIIDTVMPSVKRATKRVFPSLAERAKDLTDSSGNVIRPAEKMGLNDKVLLSFEKTLNHKAARWVNTAFANL